MNFSVSPVSVYTRHNNSVAFGSLESTDKIRNEIKIIENAIMELAKDPTCALTHQDISNYTGISKFTIGNRLHYPYARNLYSTWLKLRDERQEYVRLSRKSAMEKPPVIIDTKETPRSKKEKALYMLLSSAENGNKISYECIENATGLNKEEVDKVIADYVAIKKQNQINRNNAIRYRQACMMK